MYVGEWKSDSTLLLTSLSVYATHKSSCWNVFWEKLHFISESVFLQTVAVMWTLQLSVGVYYLNVWVKMLDFILLSYRRGSWKSGFAALDIHIVCHIPCTWLSKYDRKFCHKTTRMFPVTTSFMHTIRREITHHATHKSSWWNVFWEKLHFI
jgi:hypothetical protein